MSEQQTGFDEAVQVGTSAASHIKSLKTISTFAKTAKGAAIGGPLGAAIGAALLNKHTLSKIIVIVIAILMLPVLFILLLPGLIFGSLTSNTGALNDNLLIQQNIQAANAAIVSVLQERHDEILDQVDAEIQRLPQGDTALVVDPYATSIFVNANQLICQFCASKNQDFASINTNELSRIIRENKEGLFSYDVKTKTITMEVDTGTGAEGDAGASGSDGTQTVTFTQHQYFIQYAGDSYFAEHVFHLDDKQAKLAADYAENLATFFGGSSSGIATANVSEEVLRYRPTVERIAARYGMENYVELILAVMMQESGGRGSDPMQASESGYNTRYPRVPGGITDPEYSIECGIQALRAVLTKAGCTGPTDLDRIKLALQGYNYGSGYIDWAMKRDGGYTKENAIANADMRSPPPKGQ